MRALVRDWSHQVDKVQRVLRRIQRHRELADRAYEGYVEAILHVEQSLAESTSSAALQLRT